MKRETAIELRTGFGYNKKGNPNSTQSMVMGIHPDNGEILEFINKPETREDIPVIPFAEALDRFNRFSEALGCRKTWINDRAKKLDITRKTGSKGEDEFLKKLKEALPPLSEVCAEYVGEPIDSRQALQQCPVCFTGGKPVLGVDDNEGYAFCFWKPCASHSFGSSGGFDIFHLYGYMEEIDDFSELLDYLCEKTGLERPKPVRKKSRSKDEKIEQRRETVAKLSEKYLYLHGRLYATFDAQRWLYVPDEHELHCSIDDIHIGLHDEYVSRSLRGELLALAKIACTPPANSVELVSPSDYGKSLNVKTGDLLKGTAFLDCSVHVDHDGTYTIKERNIDELWTSEIPHMFPREPQPTPLFSAFLKEFTLGACEDDPEEAKILAKTILYMYGTCMFWNMHERFFNITGASWNR